MQTILRTGLVLFAVIALSGTALAAGPSDGSKASPCGANHGAFADASASGNFGWLGPLGGTPGYHGAVGQDPGATGYNNSQSSCHSTVP